MVPKPLIIKKGEHGALLFNGKDKIFYTPAMPYLERKCIDPTGAGDTFAGGFVGYLHANYKIITFENMKKALIICFCNGIFLCRKNGNRTFGNGLEVHSELTK